MADSKKYNGSTWEHSLRKLTTATEAVENPLYSDGTAITAYTLKGNTVQDGTPTPSAPVDVNGVGVRTENLWNESYTGIMQDTITYLPLTVGDGDYTLSSTATREGQSAVLFLLAGNVSTGATTVNNGVWNGQSRTVTAVNGYVTIGYRKYPTANPENANSMLNTGSTAKPYEPYGYKIPISSGGVTTNIYLGSTQTVRQVKKLVLTGDESGWVVSGTGRYYNLTLSDNPRERDVVMSTHFIPTHESMLPVGTFRFGGSIEAPTNPLVFNYDNGTIGLEAFKSWLASQYANGTPVIVWFIPTTAETAAVNEPLMKIGTYADTLSNAASIPTTEGANSITVDTTVQPSEFTATWTGWHDASVKEWDGSQWS